MSATREIPLTKGYVAIVDADDYEDVAQYSWCAVVRPHGVYVQRGFRKDGAQCSEQLHRRIMGCTKGDGIVVDHINHNPLDNRRVNLRAVTPRKNSGNRKRPSPWGRCVRKNSRCKTNPFQVVVQIGDRKVHVGLFPTPAAAAAARDVFEKEHGLV